MQQTEKVALTTNIISILLILIMFTLILVLYKYYTAFYGSSPHGISSVENISRVTICKVWQIPCVESTPVGLLIVNYCHT